MMLPTTPYRIACCAVLILSLAGTRPAFAEFYQYVDEQGVSHYTDDKSQIPEQHRDQSNTFTERKDKLDPTQRSLMIQQERQKEIRRRNRQAELQRQDQERRLAKLQQERQAQLAATQTPFTLDESRILLPVELGFGKFTGKTNLLLDTGATRIVIHKSVAEKLGIYKYKRRQSARVTGGALIDVGLVQLDYISVGPYRLKNPVVWVVEYDGPEVKYKGLLGMNFIKRFNPSIDLKNRTIHWHPVQ